MSAKGNIRTPASVVVLSIVTCGIYALWWQYTITKEIKFYLDDSQINPGLDLALSILCFPYYYFWTYKMGQHLMKAQGNAGLNVTDDAVLYLILAVFGLPIVNMAIMQSKVNEIWAK